MRENHSLEFKESVSASFLKTVSAFANYDGGTILFGVDDDGKAKGLQDPDAVCLDIENRINDSISPQPDYSLGVGSDGTVELSVRSGPSKPYLYRAKAYRRSGTASVPVDQLELRRLTLAGQNLSFEQLPYGDQKLTFVRLGTLFKERVGLEEFDLDTLRTLGLATAGSGYNNAAALLADSNAFPGVDSAVFGSSIDVIRRRDTFAGSCVLVEYDQTLGLYRDMYVQEEIRGSRRERVERIPESAFREALVNALAHRAWDVPSHVRVSFFEDGVEVTSPGGLPDGITEEEYLSGRVSNLRNPILAGVFFRLGLIEAYGTGVQRIRKAYLGSTSQPTFSVTEESIQVTLPVVSGIPSLSADQEAVLSSLSRVVPKPMAVIVSQTGLSRSKALRVVNELVELGIIEPEGAGRGTRYRKAV